MLYIVEWHNISIPKDCGKDLDWIECNRDVDDNYVGPKSYQPLVKWRRKTTHSRRGGRMGRMPA
jgi:hypothetical protein